MDIIPAIAAGLKDSVNPCALTTLSLFIFALLAVSRGSSLILSFGAYFLGAAFLVSVGILLGWADFFLGSYQAQQMLRSVQVVLGYVLTALGIVHLYDWACLKIFSGRRRTMVPYPLEWKISDNAAKLLGIAAGTLLMTAQSIWPPEYGLVVFFYNVYLPGKYFTAFWGMGVYTFFLMLPPAVFFGLYYAAARRGYLKMIVEKQTAMIRIVLAGFFVSLGIGLVRLFN